MHVGPLRQSDEVTVREWAEAYLADYLRHYAQSFGQPMDDDAIRAHIESHDLDSVLWHDVVHADYADDEYVGTMREGNAPLGMVLATTRFDPYMRVPVGAIKWIFVSPKHRRAGISKQLVEAARTWMSGRGIKTVETTVSAASESVTALYEGVGLSPLEIRFSGSTK